MPNMEDQDEVELKQRIRSLIQENGKAARVAEQTGIPLGTLNKYVAMRSAPSVVNAAKLARFAGVSLEELVSGVRVVGPDTHGTGYETVADAVSFEVRETLDPALYERLYIAVEAVHRDLSLTAPAHRIARVTAEVLENLRRRVSSLHDAPVLEAVIPVVLSELRSALAEAYRSPGTGKRSAS